MSTGNIEIKYEQPEDRPIESIRYQTGACNSVNVTNGKGITKHCIRIQVGDRDNIKGVIAHEDVDEFCRLLKKMVKQGERVEAAG